MFIQACYYIMRWYTYFIHYINKLITISIPIKTDNINNLEIIKYKDQPKFIQYTNNNISIFFPEQICCNYKFISLNIHETSIQLNTNLQLMDGMHLKRLLAESHVQKQQVDLQIVS